MEISLAGVPVSGADTAEALATYMPCDGSGTEQV